MPSRWRSPPSCCGSLCPGSPNTGSVGHNALAGWRNAPPDGAMPRPARPRPRLQVTPSLPAGARPRQDGASRMIWQTLPSHRVNFPLPAPQPHCSALHPSRQVRPPPDRRTILSVCPNFPTAPRNTRFGQPRTQSSRLNAASSWRNTASDQRSIPSGRPTIRSVCHIFQSARPTTPTGDAHLPSALQDAPPRRTPTPLGRGATSLGFG